MRVLGLGIDIGSTTAKAALIDEGGGLLWSDYRRHNADVAGSLLAMLGEAEAILSEELRRASFRVVLTGSAGMGVAERTSLPFVQEVVASAEYVRRSHPETRTLVDLGGEDAKIILFEEGRRPDIRMNGNCAGGTGAFIDQMASLLGVPVEEIGALAERSSRWYPIASRCGVFAKTDVQNLLSRDVPAPDVAASIFRAVAYQAVNSLARGSELRAPLLFAGGPLSFIPTLREAFRELLGLDAGDLILPPRPQLIPALGAALGAEDGTAGLRMGELRDLIASSGPSVSAAEGCLAPLFADEADYEAWSARNARAAMRRVPLESLDGKPVFLGIDSGSTTTKIVLVDEEGAIALDYYASNGGHPIEAVARGLERFAGEIASKGLDIRVARSAVTGYGEDLMRFAFGIDEGLVETLAHARAALDFDPETSFILDIGGQDMKAIRLREGVIHDLEVNEACSSGAGSFIETFAKTLGHGVADFARLAVSARAPRDLGTRCTVFMNSKVKQSLREGATVADISAGLAYSVIRNCFNKLLKLSDTDSLGEHVVVQGGTFRNPAVLRAMEAILGREVTRPSSPELMGAWGCALRARDAYRAGPARASSFIGFARAAEALDHERRTFACGGCENNCSITTLGFRSRTEEGVELRRFHSGNKCERIFSNGGTAADRGRDLHEAKLRLLFDRPGEPAAGEGARMTIGIPRALNLYENFPFWSTLFTRAGFRVVLSSPSSMALADKGAGTVMSENVCFPAKLAHGHVMDLVEKGVDRIFFPTVRQERDEALGARNSFNCPVVTGYPDVIRSAMNPEARYGIPFDHPALSFRNEALLEESCRDYLSKLGVEETVFREAFRAALSEQDRYRRELRREAASILEEAEAEGRLVVLLLGRPYHADPLVSHKIGRMIADFGASVITEDGVPESARSDLRGTEVLTQWAYPNRIYDAALWGAGRPGLELIELNSFGCGPDALTVDEVRTIAAEAGKSLTAIRVDEMTSPGAMRLRVRSLIESVRLRGGVAGRPQTRGRVKVYGKEDRKRVLLAPLFSPFFTLFITAVFGDQGYRIVTLPMPDRRSVELGLKYSNNDICYPATIVIGDLLKALQDGEWKPDEVALAITQTGGQCRASSYASLLKKALLRAGYPQVPVVTLSTSTGGAKDLNEQPGFRVGKLGINVKGMFMLLFGDALAKLHYWTAARELEKGRSKALTDSYLERAASYSKLSRVAGLFGLLAEAVEDFNRVPVDLAERPRVGIVGEIYVKYNPFGNGFIVDWLMERGIEVEVPPITDFFIKRFVNDEYNAEARLAERRPLYLAGLGALGRIVESQVERANRVLSGFRGYRPFHSIRELAEDGRSVISLANQFGEAWLLPAEIVRFAKDGVHDVVCLQPFGCIANHVIAKGAEKRIKELHPEVNILFLDMDSGSSEVNAVNRLAFLVKGAKESFEARLAREAPAPSERRREPEGVPL